MPSDHASSARRTKPRIPRGVMQLRMATLHACLGSIIIDPMNDDLYAGVDEACYQIWEWCLERGQQPWGWCWDRYCSCKLALAEHEPDPLPGFGAAAPF